MVRVILSKEQVHFILISMCLSSCLSLSLSPHILSQISFIQARIKSQKQKTHERIHIIRNSFFLFFLLPFSSFYSTHKNEIDNFLQINYIYFKYHHLHTDKEYIFRQFDKIAARVYNTLCDIGSTPIKCLSVHTATIQNIHSFSLLRCTNTEYTQWTNEKQTIYTITAKNLVVVSA